MTKVNHRHNSLSPARRTGAAFDSASQRELAYLDAMVHIATDQYRHRNQHHRLCSARETNRTQFVYELPAKRDSRNGGSR